MGLEMNGGGRSRGGPGRNRPGGMPRQWSLHSPRPAPDEVLPDLPDGASLDDEPPIDLSPLAGTPSAARWDELVARIERAAEPELERRARLTTGVLDFVPLLARSLRPALVAAAAALVLGVGLTRVGRVADGLDLATGAGTTVAGTAGDLVTGQLLSDATVDRALPFSPDEAWVTQQRAPSTAALAEAVGLGEADWVP